MFTFLKKAFPYACAAGLFAYSAKSELDRRKLISEYEANMQKRGYEKYFTGKMKESISYDVINGCPIERKFSDPVYGWRKKQEDGEDLIEEYDASKYNSPSL
ncbi:MAG: hypothetical protein AB7F64_07400 [Gammaproteobacteria bacterium]